MTNPTRRKHRPTTRQRRKHRQINPPHPPAAATDDAAAIPEAPAVAAAIGIPDDVFFYHIFVNLPVRSLSRFRAVCRSWHAAVDDPALVRRHLELSSARQPPTSSLLAVASSEDVWDEALSDSDSEVCQLPPANTYPASGGGRTERESESGGGGCGGAATHHLRD